MMHPTPVSADVRVSLPMFACVPMGCRLTVESCAGRRRAARAKSIKPAVRRLVSPTCAECPVGLAHSRGQSPATWPDGSPIARDVPLGAVLPPAAPMFSVTLPTRTGSLVTAACHRRRRARAAGKPRVVRPGTIPYRGDLVSVSYLERTPEARALGLARETIRGRLRGGWDAERAVSTPADKGSGARGRVWREVVYLGETMGLAEYARRTGQTLKQARARIVESGMSPEAAAERARRVHG